MKLDFNKELKIDRKLFNNNGLRITKQRELIYDIFLRMGRHQSVDSVYEECLKNGLHLGKTTIYRTLNLFVELGLIDMLTIKSFPILYENKKEHHHHFVCVNCRKVFDISGCAVNGYMPQGNFHILSHDIVFYGLCDKCYKRRNQK